MVANNITGVVAVIFSVIAGAILNKIGFRPMAIIGFLVMIIGGLYPFFFPEATNFGLVMSSRILVGVGEGLITPVGAALIILFLDGEQRSRFLGFRRHGNHIKSCDRQIVSSFLLKSPAPTGLFHTVKGFVLLRQTFSTHPPLHLRDPLQNAHGKYRF
jgi:fucose permease